MGGMKIDITPADLRNLYETELLSAREIARKLGKSPSAVFYVLQRYGVPLRNRSQAMKVGVKQGRVQLLKGEKNPRWKGGRVTHADYVMVHCPEHPKAKRGYIWEHILVWEKSHNSQLPEGWIVHHLNGRKHDNRPGNLLALPRKSHHYALLLKGLRERIRDLEAQLTQRRFFEPDEN